MDVCRKESSRYCLHRYGIIVHSASIVEFFKLHLDSYIEFACLFLFLLALVHENLELHATNYATLMKLTMITWQFPGDCSRIAYTWSGNSYWISSRINSNNIHAYLLTARSLFLAFQITIALISCKKENKASLTECNWQLIRCLWKCMLDAGNRSSIKVSVSWIKVKYAFNVASLLEPLTCTLALAWCLACHVTAEEECVTSHKDASHANEQRRLG